jgi:hypothetical protein
MDEKLRIPSRAEEKKINRDINNDPDTFEASDEDFTKSKPASKVLPRVLYIGHQTPRWHARMNRDLRRGIKAG